MLTREEKHLTIRAFSTSQKKNADEMEKGICVKCKKNCEMEEREADNIKPCHEGGKTVDKNCQRLCKQDNIIKAGKRKMDNISCRPATKARKGSGVRR